MRIEFNRTGAERKELAKAIAEFTEGKVRYLGAPTFAYQVDTINIDKSGCLSFDDGVEEEYFNDLVEFLAQKGFEGTAPEMPHTAAESEAEEVSAESETTEHKPTQGEQCESIDLTITLPLESVAVGNLSKLLDAKGGLIKRLSVWMSWALRSTRKAKRFVFLGSARSALTKQWPIHISSRHSAK